MMMYLTRAEADRQDESDLHQMVTQFHEYVPRVSRQRQPVRVQGRADVRYDAAPLPDGETG